MKVRWTELSLSRLVEIEAHVAIDDEGAAERLVTRIIEEASALAAHPSIGRVVPELPHGELRELVVGKYRVIYRVRSKTVEILTVFEGHRRLRVSELDE